MTARCKKERSLPVRLALGVCNVIGDGLALARYGLVASVLLGAKGLTYMLLRLGLPRQQPYETLRALVYIVAFGLFLTAAFVVSVAGVWLLPYPYHLATSGLFGVLFAPVLRGVIYEVLGYAQETYAKREGPTP